MHRPAIPIYTEKESFGSATDFFITTYTDAEPERLKRIDPHRHTYFEIIWVEKGKGIHTIDFHPYKFKGPCLFLLHPQNIHTIAKHQTTSGGVVKFTESFFASDEGQEDFLLKYNVFDDVDVMPVINLTKSEALTIRKLFSEIVSAFKEQSFFTAAIVVSYLKIVLLKIYEIKKRSLPVSSFKNPDFLRYQNFHKNLNTSYAQHHEVLFYSDRLHVSPKTLGNITRKFTGKSPQALIKDRLLLEAKRLLNHSSLTVKEISGSLGFDDSSYFIRFFKKNIGTSPGDYRELIS